ncbi:MAG TPA: hypothetical protein DD381_07930 [Lentisphaeria bacterium]|nr:MAG: hypothetical protein A2X47_04495 [Lentisphaerae bacterium GWF2_38_69]HBM16250.1 hypothetical protein [Lentisphaeria bacterium]
MIKKQVLFLICLQMCLAFAAFAAQTPTVVQPVVTSGSMKLLTFPDAKDELISELDKLDSKDSLFLEIYELDDQNASKLGSIENQLAELSQRGVSFYMIYDDFISKGSPSDREKYIEEHEQKLCKDNNWNGYPSTKKFNLTHSKTFLAPDKFAIVMTANLVDNDESPVNQNWSTSRDFALYTTNKGVMNSIQDVFNCDTESSGDGGKHEPDASSLAPEIVLSPINSKEKLSNLIDNAKSRITIYMESFSNYKTGDLTTILDKLAQKAAKGIKVKALVQDTVVMGSDWNKTRITQLYNDYKDNPTVLNNLDIRLCHLEETLYVHAKVIVVDSNTFYLGSINISNNSMNEDRELGIIISNSDIAQAIERQFRSDWDYFSSTPNSYYDLNPSHK